MTIQTERKTLPAGRYWIGDLCYVMHDEWCEVCKLFFPDREAAEKFISCEGVFTLKDGRSFASFGTEYGDGQYLSNDGLEFPVDSGSIGCILLKDIDVKNSNNKLELGHICDLSGPDGTDFIVSSDEGVLKFGHVVINTGNEDTDYDEGSAW